MRNLFRKLRRARYNYEPLIEIYLSKSSLLHNLREFQKIAPEGGIAPVLKSNAYGHGLIQIAKILDKEDLPFLVVDSYFEALTLRTEGIKTPILIIGYTTAENIYNNHLKKISFTITSLDQLKELSDKLETPTTFHLKIDTGMNRQGVRIEDLENSIDLIKKNPNIILEGITSHFSDASNLKTDFTEAQIKKWNKSVKHILGEFPGIKYRHLSATGGHHFTPGIEANVSRLGLGLYGLTPGPRLKEKLDLCPILSMETSVSGVKPVMAGEAVGYELLFHASKDLILATIPAGYYEGIDKRLTNKGIIKIKNVDCPIVGRVSMNITTLDASNVLDLKLNDEALIISDDPSDQNSIENMAKLCGTSPYEILVHLPRQIRRTVVE